MKTQEVAPEEITLEKIVERKSQNVKRKEEIMMMLRCMKVRIQVDPIGWIARRNIR